MSLWSCELLHNGYLVKQLKHIYTVYACAGWMLVCMFQHPSILGWEGTMGCLLSRLHDSWRTWPKLSDVCTLEWAGNNTGWLRPPTHVGPYQEKGSESISYLVRDSHKRTSRTSHEGLEQAEGHEEINPLNAEQHFTNQTKVPDLHWTSFN